MRKLIYIVSAVAVLGLAFVTIDAILFAQSAEAYSVTKTRSYWWTPWGGGRYWVTECYRDYSWWEEWFQGGRDGWYLCYRV